MERSCLCLGSHYLPLFQPDDEELPVLGVPLPALFHPDDEELPVHRVHLPAFLHVARVLLPALLQSDDK
jgi:hypothetical protein